MFETTTQNKTEENTADVPQFKATHHRGLSRHGNARMPGHVVHLSSPYAYTNVLKQWKVKSSDTPED